MKICQSKLNDKSRGCVKAVSIRNILMVTPDRSKIHAPLYTCQSNIFQMNHRRDSLYHQFRNSVHLEKGDVHIYIFQSGAMGNQVIRSMQVMMIGA